MAAAISWKRFALGWAVSLAVLVATWFLSFDGPPDWSRLTTDARPSLMAASLLMLLIGQGIRSQLSRTTLAGLGRRISASQSFAAWHASQLAKYLPGAVWVFPARMSLYARFGVPRVVGSVSVFVEMVVLVASAITLGLLVPQASTQLDGPTIGFGIAVITVIGLIGHRRGWPSALERRLRRYVDLGSIDVPRGRRLVTAVAGPASVAFVSWVFVGVGFSLLVSAFDERLGVAEAIGVYSTAWAIGFVTVIAPGGLGPREAALTAMLAGTMGASTAFAIALAARVWWLVAELADAVVAGGLMAGSSNSADSEEVS